LPAPDATLQQQGEACRADTLQADLRLGDAARQREPRCLGALPRYPTRERLYSGGET
jgi:hypothetical protein